MHQFWVKAGAVLVYLLWKMVRPLRAMGLVLCLLLCLWACVTYVIAALTHLNSSLGAGGGGDASTNTASTNMASIRERAASSGEERMLEEGGAMDMALIHEAILAEKALLATFRSCLGSKCFDERVEDLDRVGVLAIPYSGAEALSDALRELEREDTTLQIAHDAHVPAYGYGKNHGWSRIVRVVRSILPHAHHILTIFGKFTGDNPRDEHLYDQQVRQLIRWHCRLSHVAAHTKTLTVFLEDVNKRPKVELQKIASFAGVSLTVKDSSKTFEQVIRQIAGSVARLSDKLKSIPRNYIKVGVKAISEEMSSTKGLSDWPCKLFSKLDPALPILPTSLTANCSESFVKCTVEYDRLGG